MKTSITLFILSGILAYIGSEVVVSQVMSNWFIGASLITFTASGFYLIDYGMNN
jgi:hypothetical protein